MTTTQQLLFIFPTRFNLTTITLHYHSDRVRGLPRLRFFAVPDDFNIWNSLTSTDRYVQVAAVSYSGEPADNKNVGIEFNVNTKKVLLFKFENALFIFAIVSQ